MRETPRGRRRLGQPGPLLDRQLRMTLCSGGRQKIDVEQHQNKHMSRERAKVLNDEAISFSNSNTNLAEGKFLDAIKEDPAWEIPYNNLAVFYRNTGRTQDALHWLRKFRQVISNVEKKCDRCHKPLEKYEGGFGGMADQSEGVNCPQCRIRLCNNCHPPAEGATCSRCCGPLRPNFSIHLAEW